MVEYENQRERGKKSSLINRPLTNIDLVKLAKEYRIPHFRGVYMRDNLPRSTPHKEESAIVNLDSRTGPGTHWVCYNKKGMWVKYFDSFGDLQPPLELIRYWGPRVIVDYNSKRKQNFNSFNCGHLCLKFLKQNA